MHYIVFDLEFNQDFPSMMLPDSHSAVNLFEIIQIGAVKLDMALAPISTFSRFIRPSVYARVNPIVTALTGIATEQLTNEEAFPQVFQDFMAFIQETDAILCVWGLSDMKVLFRNVDFHKQNRALLPLRYINLQSHASKALGFSAKRQIQLEKAVELLSINKSSGFHDAFHDALYAAEIFRKIYHPAIKAAVYDPNNRGARVRPKRQEIDFKALIDQFEKMYDRPLTDEEQDMVKLAYKMGRTRQFIK
jgi:inhibitor of KinA sporulation pathway (predicted exonuclease)